MVYSLQRYKDNKTEILIGQPSKVGNGLKTIALNIAALAAETDTYTAANGKVKIALKDANGEMRSTYDIMKDLYTGVEGQSAAWDELSNVEKAAMGEALAGKNQYNVFTSVMENFESAIGATSTALDSQGSAARENAKYMDSLNKMGLDKQVKLRETLYDFSTNVKTKNIRQSAAKVFINKVHRLK